MKKGLCILLSVLLAFSCSTGIVALATSTEDVSAAINNYDKDALAADFTALMDPNGYPASAMAALNALLADYNALSQEEVNAVDADVYLRLVDIIYDAKLWNDWDAAGRPTDMMTDFMLYSAWMSASSDKNADAAAKLTYVPQFTKNPAARAFLQLAALPEPYTNADIAAAKAAYTAVPAALWSLLRAEDNDAVEAAMQAYRAILASVGPDEQTDNAVDLSAYQTAESGSVTISAKTLHRLLKLLSAFGTDAEGTLAALPAKLATGQNVIGFMTMLAGVHPMMSAFVTPAALAGALGRDPKFKGAAEKLNALIEAGHIALVETETDADGNSSVVWQADKDPDITFTSADFGFEDGDLYGFIDALGAAFSGVGGLLSILGAFKNTRDTQNGVYNYGNYEDLIPLYEILDLPALSSVEFTEAEETARYTDENGNEYADEVRAGVVAALKPVADYFTGEEFTKHPTEALLALLPKLAYAVESGLLQNTVDSLLGSLSSFGVRVDLSVDGVWALLDEKLVSGDDAGIDLNKDGVKEPLPLTRESFASLLHALAYSAVPVVKPSVSAHALNRLGLEVSAETTATAIASSFAEILTTQEGKDFVDTLLDGVQASSVVKKLSEKVKELLTAEGGLQKLIGLMDSPLFGVVLFVIRIVRIFNTLKQNFGFSRIC